ncbi:hypothetical protein CVU82_00900 [Candidatus Falkowbacteria bacterium HGW-Falkowbacteria-1]|jgi:CheY-like chemotaxis protein|uniref:Response regulatory domain-containing protein n=1 Tax=Candidatus Falkowbacteria bacterium HGW-Falkowbacteria-1 TaxID=2013768 RepID=A0A2N2EAN6_9BACT|nr:MAG: hypothetical protein CVU82_00900 [Candidatus Falkowbacteria bacterium HGW-Falkowbacteria-1]
MKILIIDNDVSTTTTLVALLMSQEAFQIDVAHGGQEGLNKMTANPDYDLILLDIMMPNVSGLDVCKAMVKDPSLKSIPVLLMSSALPIPPEEFHKTLEKFSESSLIKGVLEKPFVIDDLIAQIHKVARK